MRPANHESGSVDYIIGVHLQTGAEWVLATSTHIAVIADYRIFRVDTHTNYMTAFHPTLKHDWILE